MKRFIINLDPAHPTYLVSSSLRTDGVLSPLPCHWVTKSTSDKATAKRFSSFEEARSVTASLRGWGGAERIEEIDERVDPILPRFDLTLEDGQLVYASFWTRRSRLMGDRFLEVWASVHGLRGSGSYSFCTAMEEEDIASLCEAEIENLKRLGHLPK